MVAVATTIKQSRNVQIVEALLAGQDIESVAATYGISGRQVYRILADDDYRQILEQGQREQIALVPKANRVLAGLIDSKDEKIQLGAIKQVHQNTGISPSHAPSVYIDKLLIQQGNSSEDAAFRATAMAFLGLSDPDTQTQAIDVTPKNNE